ncbi:adenylate/guanylate cyclase domain-containing protein [Verrucomicrobiales bacterium BCK34]|nr:adenylate/guanylate cyclase domain-containing protein [Verrucomicrobiales bacterium BCK34]
MEASSETTETGPRGSSAGAWWLILPVLALFTALRIGLPDFAGEPELLSLDEALQARASLGLAKPLDPSIRFAELTMNESIARRFAENGEYATAAEILKTIASLGARVIAVDIIYTWGREKDQQLLADTIREINATGSTTVVLPVSIENGPNGQSLLQSLPQGGGNEFARGSVNVTPGNHWREYQMVHRFKDETIPSLALAALGATLPKALAPRATEPGAMQWKTLSEGAVTTSRADTSRLFLNLQHSYYDNQFEKPIEGAKHLQRVWSIEDLEDLAERSKGNSPLKDTIVFFGYGAEVDGKLTAHGDLEPGMLLHGTALNDLFERTSIRPAGLVFDLLLYLATALLAVFVFIRMKRKRWLIIVAIGGALLILLTGWIAIWEGHLLIASVNAAMIWGLLAVLETGRRWSFEQRERLHRDAMLGFYFSPSVLKQVTKDLGMIKPKGSRVAVLLSDLRGFTNLCETQKVERVFELMNQLFAVETDAALKENGSLARFAGDQFLAYWGAPEPYDDASDRALRAALEIQRTLIRRQKAAAEGELDSWLRIGVGLHVGEGLVGHVGSRSYRDYNIVGDSVNTTARVEGQTKNYAAPVLATGQFVESLSTRPPSLKVDVVQVKGKAKATELFAIFLEGDEAPMEAARDYEKAFSLYESGDFSTAKTQFETLSAHSHDTVSTSAKLLKNRCEELANDPPEAWDGVFELTSK